VQVPLRPDLAIDMPPVVVRVLTWQGRALAESPLVVDASSAELYHGRCLLRVASPDDRPALEAADITVDIALAVLPPPDAGSLRQMARSRAVRAGKEAVLARRAGQRVAETERWLRCAALLRAASEPDLAEQADAHARASAATTASWVDAVLARVSELAAHPDGVPAGSPGERHIEKQRLLVRDLSYAAGAVAELVTAREQLAEMLLNGDEDDRDEATEQLREALQEAYSIGDETAAARLLRKLRLLPDSEAAS
jgi:hypothetical protein